MPTTEYGVDAFFQNAGTSPKMVYDVAGTLGWSPHNRLTQSQTLNTSWTTLNTTVVANQAIAPDGTTTMDLVYPTTTGASRWISGVAGVATPAGMIPVSVSVYAKMAGKRWIAFLKFDGSATGAWFDLQNGVVGTVVAGYTSAIQDIGNGIYRCTITSNVTTVFSYQNILITDADNSTTATANGTDGVYLWGAQLNNGPVATAYLPTTTAARFGLALDYDPVTHAAKGLLCEPAATNLQKATAILMDPTVWGTPVASTVTSGGTAPTGQPAFILTEDTATTTHTMTCINGQQAGSTIGTVYTISFHVKANGRTRFRCYTFALNNYIVFFDLTAGTMDNASGGTAPSARITPVGNGWYRCEVTDQATAATLRPQIDLVSTGTTVNYTGNGTSGLYMWNMFQTEAGAVATSPIPTFAATATRAGDAYNITSASINASATAGSWWADINNLTAPAAGRIVGYTTGTVIPMSVAGATNFQLNETTSLYKTVTSVLGARKVAAAFQAGDRALTADGLVVTADAGSTTSLLNPGATIGIGSQPGGGGNSMQGYIRKVRYVPRRKTNAELVTETT